MPRSTATPAKPAFFATPAAFRAWLEKHHATARELLVGFYKRTAAGRASRGPSRWTRRCASDGSTASGAASDPRPYSIRFTPRKPTSIWSRINVDNVERLTKEGRMRPAGLRAYAAAHARQDGRLLVRALSGRTVDGPRGKGAPREQKGCRILRRTASLVSPVDDPLGHEREARGHARAPAGAVDQGLRRRAANRTCAALREVRSGSRSRTF